MRIYHMTAARYVSFILVFASVSHVATYRVRHWYTRGIERNHTNVDNQFSLRDIIARSTNVKTFLDASAAEMNDFNIERGSAMSESLHEPSKSSNSAANGINTLQLVNPEVNSNGDEGDASTGDKSNRDSKPISSDILNTSHIGDVTKNDGSDDECDAGPEEVAQERARTNIVMRVSYDGGDYNGFVGPNHFFNEMLQQQSLPKNRMKCSPVASRSRSVSNEILRAIALLHGYLPSKKKRKRGDSNHNGSDTGENQKEEDEDTSAAYNLPSERRFSLISASRTDKGVHAIETACQYLSFDKDAPSSGDLDFIMDSLNRLLPEDIRIQSMINAPHPNFNVRFHNIGKVYMYKVDISDVPNLFDRKYYWQLNADRQFKNTMLRKFKYLKKDFSFDRMRAAADVIEGTHNFEGFRKKSRGNEKDIPKDPICSIKRIDIERYDTDTGSGKFHIIIKGDRFLYKMVRGIVSHLILVGYDVLEVKQIVQMLESGKEIPHIQYAPSIGLYLYKVLFAPEVERMLEESKERSRQRAKDILTPV